MAQPPKRPSTHSLRADLIDGAKRRWVVAGGGLAGLAAIVAITPVFFSPAIPAVQLALTPTAVIIRPTQLPTAGITRSATATSISAHIVTPALPDTLVEARVVRVVDGSTVEIDVDGRAVVVRLAGIRAPSLSPSMCFGREATDYTQAMISSWGERIWLERDISSEDGAGRLLRYVWLEMQGGKRMLNEALLEGGFAKAEVSEPDTRYKDRFLTIEHDARVAKRGLWGVCDGVGAILPTQESTILPTINVPPPTQQIITPTIPPTSSPMIEVSPTVRPSSTRLPSPSPTTSLTARRTAVSPSPTKPAPPTEVPTRVPTRTAEPAVPSATPTIARPPTTPPTQPAPSPTSLPQQTPEPQPQPTATTIPTVPVEILPPTATTTGLRYDPNGPDRDCPDFDTWEEAQAFFIAAGGPESDPHRLDGDNDGIACENLR